MAIASTTYRSGETLFKEGADSGCLFLVKVGRISIRKSVDDGFIEIAQIGPNQILGEIGFFDRRPRSADAVALTYCEVVEIQYEALAPMFDPAPDYLKRIMTGLATRLRDADEVIRELKERLGENDVSLRGKQDEPEEEPESETAKILKQTEE
jgi:CRP/FNR family cyclic AMP-dependent transcriptional regulator